MCSIHVELSSSRTVKCGIPQGSILGLLLFSIYINDLPNCLEYSSTRIFADDTTLTTSGMNFNEVEAALNSDLDNFKEWLFTNKLSFNLVKTEYLLIGSIPNMKNLLVEPKYCCRRCINRVRVTKALEVQVHEFLSLDKHIDNISKKILSGIGAIKRLKPFVNRETLKSAYNALFLLHFDYCCEVWDSIGISLSVRLQKLPSRAARVITDAKMNIVSLHLL